MAIAAISFVVLLAFVGVGIAVMKALQRATRRQQYQRWLELKGVTSEERAEQQRLAWHLGIANIGDPIRDEDGVWQDKNVNWDKLRL